MEVERISFSDRIAAAALSAFVMMIMALCFPIFLAVLSRGRGLEILGAFGTFHTWGATVSGVAALVGFALGIERVVVLFGHLWGTARPQRPAFTLFLWSTLIGVASVSYWFFGSHQAL